MVEFGVTNLHSFSKRQQFVKRKIIEKNKNELLEQAKGYKKICSQQLSEEVYEVKPYLYKLNLRQSQMRLKLRASMTPTVRMNFKNDPQFTRELWVCPDCRDPGSAVGSPDTESHIMTTCPANEALREKKDFSDDRQLVDFFMEVINRRQSCS